MSENRREFEGFLEHDPAGCLIAEVDGKPAGLAVATGYGRSGFFGELIVSPEYRGHGIGARLLSTAVEYLKKRRAETISLDGVPEAVTLYERAGFVKRTRSLRFSGRIKLPAPPAGRLMQADDLPAVLALDLGLFGDDRSFFLRRRFRFFPQFCSVMEKNGRLHGFIMAKRVGNLIRVGPIIFEGNEPPVGLLEALPESPDDKLAVGVLESHPRAAQWLRSLGLAEEPNPPWRMVCGAGDPPGFSESAWAIGTPAKG
jgi:predicted GNAT family acetyltransferase